jgi:hypothetical protein
MDNDNVIKQQFNKFLDLFRNKDFLNNTSTKYKNSIFEYQTYNKTFIIESTSKSRDLNILDKINHLELNKEIVELKKEISLLKLREIKYNINRLYTIQLIDSFVQD